MKAGEIDLNKLKALIASMPSGVEVESITFEGNEYQLHIIAGTSEYKKFKYDDALSELQKLLSSKYLSANDTKKLE